MKQTTMIETTIEVELDPTEVLAYVNEKKLIPSDWQFYSVEVVGKGVSNGARLIIKHTAAKRP